MISYALRAIDNVQALVVTKSNTWRTFSRTAHVCFFPKPNLAAKPSMSDCMRSSGYMLYPARVGRLPTAWGTGPTLPLIITKRTTRKPMNYTLVVTSYLAWNLGIDVQGKTRKPEWRTQQARQGWKLIMSKEWVFTSCSRRYFGTVTTIFLHVVKLIHKAKERTCNCHLNASL